MKRHTDVKNLTKLAMLVAMASAVHLLEGAFAPLFPAMPGAKLGLANAFTLYALLHMRPKDALLIGVLRCLIGLLIAGTVTGFLYSLAGALLSFLGMLLLMKLKFSVYAVSLAGAVCHNTAQLGVAILLTQTPSLVLYWPWLLLFAIPTGLLIAGLERLSYKAIEKGTKHGK
jgi:heptaprenyl diphosphate synthase